MVERHRLAPTVYRNFTTHFSAALPEPVLSALKQKADTNQQRILQLLAALSHITSWFAQSKIKLIALKGPLLAQRLFEDVSLRTSRDLDLLIPAKSLAEAEDLLLTHGCKRIQPAAALTPRQWAAYKTEWFHFVYTLPERQVTIELHWTITSPYLIGPEDVRRMVSRAHPLPDGGGLSILADEDLPVYLLIHGARHNWVRLKWLVDFVGWMRRAEQADWINLTKRMAELDLSRLLGQGILLANWLYAIPVPYQVQPLLQRDRTIHRMARQSLNKILDVRHPGAEAGQLSRLKHVLYLTNLKKSPRYKWEVLSKIMLLPKDWQDLALPDSLFPLYGLLRPFLWLWRYHLRPREKPGQGQDMD